MTRRQFDVYDFICKFIAEHHYSPSLDEIGAGVGLSSLATVHKHISNLEQKGLLKRDYNRSRSILLVPQEKAPRATIAGALHESYARGLRDAAALAERSKAFQLANDILHLESAELARDCSA